MVRIAARQGSPFVTYTIVAAGNVLLEQRTQSHLAIVDGLLLAFHLQQE